MSVQNARKFFDEVDKDPALQKKLGKSMQQIIKTAKKKGFEFSAEDMRKHLKSRWGMTKAPKLTQTDMCTFA
jgi:predicted ribosomally synthesized peptide with nif11-like leader